MRTTLALAAALTLAASSPFEVKLEKRDKISHALNRLTFGPRPGDPELVRKTGLEKWIALQLHPESIPENQVLLEKLQPFETLGMSSAEIAGQFPRKSAKPKQPGAKPAAIPGRQLAAAKLYRALYSNRQLEEVLADFWFNHFNVYMNKGADRLMLTSYERDAIRPHVLGNFRDLLLATARHPAMLYYLDNWQSVDPEAANRLPRRAAAKTGPKKTIRGLNENYARELLELHTLGVDGGYTQKDINEVARCFTGWTIRNPGQGGDFIFRPMLHDNGEKHLLGVTIPAGGGEQDAVKVIDILARHPSTARFISRKLAQRFVADDPPESLVNGMSAVYLKSGGDIRAVMFAMVRSKEFFSQGAWHAKIKSPLELVVSAVRLLDANVDTAFPLLAQVDQLGEPLYRKEEPTGYSNQSQEWINTGALLGRMNFATQLAANKIPGVRVDAAQIRGLSDHEQKSAQPSGLYLGSPDFQRR